MSRCLDRIQGMMFLRFNELSPARTACRAIIWCRCSLFVSAAITLPSLMADPFAIRWSASHINELPGAWLAR